MLRKGRSTKKFENPWLKVSMLHRCIRVENPGEGLPEVFAKIPRGSKLAGKIARGAPFLGFIV
jgi:hypothetical protein